MSTFVTLTQIKNHLGISGSTYDTVLTDIVDGIEEEILDLLPTFRELTWNEMLFVPSEIHDIEDCGEDSIVLEHQHVDSIVLMTDLATNQAIDSNAYFLKKRDGMVELKAGRFAPSKYALDLSYIVVAGSTPADITLTVINSVKRQFSYPDEDPTLPPSVRRFKDGDREIENAPGNKIIANLSEDERKYIIGRYKTKFRHSTSRYANLRIR